MPRVVVSSHRARQLQSDLGCMSVEGPVATAQQPDSRLHVRIELAFFLPHRFLSLLVRFENICSVGLLLHLLLLVSTAA